MYSTRLIQADYKLQGYLADVLQFQRVVADGN